MKEYYYFILFNMVEDSFLHYTFPFKFSWGGPEHVIYLLDLQKITALNNDFYYNNEIMIMKKFINNFDDILIVPVFDDIVFADINEGIMNKSIFVRAIKI